MRIVVINCNTNPMITEQLAIIGQNAAGKDIQVHALTPPFGPESAEGFYESFVSAAGMFAALESVTDPFDAIVLAGFGEHGREGVRQRWNVPVVDITEAAPMMANLVAHRYGVVTTLSVTVPGIWESLRNAGLDTRCVGVRASGIPVSAIHHDAAEVASSLEQDSWKLIEAGAEAIVLGCAGFAAVDIELSRRIGVPVIDGVQAGVRLAKTLVEAGLQTSEVGAYRPPNPSKTWVGWPPVATSDPEAAVSSPVY